MLSPLLSEPEERRRHREQVIARFEAAWRAGERPAIDEFLPPEAADRKSLLVELAHTELEYRLKAGEDVRVETYLERFPELVGERSLALTMIAAEYHFRVQRDSGARWEEYLERFPQLRNDLASLLKAVESHSLRKQETLPVGKVDVVRGWPEVPGYTILAEVGHGGMGVVYKARQDGLDRVVALKTVLDGAYANPEAAARFRWEATAVARLQHPQIVQVYEVGEHAGRPYFSLEFVSGGNLAEKIARTPVPPEEGAALVEGLARAIQHAHQHGIVHRDLKPANVLLTEEGMPKVTDFGLAKWTEGCTHHTRTGAILGTPAYMAPEQAAGRTGDIGPATDIHALGAILYELVAGKPPFQGKTVAEVLEQVRCQEVVPPSRLRPKVPRDLETIALKALTKEPGHRYHSALALAQDLERFRNGEPILARREAIARKLLRKARRNPLPITAGLAAAVAVLVTAYVAPRALRDREIVGLVKRIDDGLREEDWDHVERLDALIAELGERSPEQATLADRRLRHEWRESLRRHMQGPHDAARMARQLTAFAARDPGAARDLREEYGRRTRIWRPLFELAAPFAKLDQVFDPSKLQVAGERLLAPADQPLLTRIACQGNVELQAEFDPAWDSAAELALLLNSQGQKGYTFRLAAAAPLRSAGPANAGPRSLAQARADGQDVRVQIVRNGMVLREVRVLATTLEAGPLRLEAKREGDRLTFQVNKLTALEFREAFPAAAREAGWFGVRWAPGVGLRRLRADCQDVPLLPSPLEQGDDWFARGDFRRAREFYRQQAEAAVGRHDDLTFQEARYKEGLCLLELNRPSEEAVPIFQEVAGGVPGPANLWPLRADCQLLQIHLEQQETDQADAILEKLSAQGGKDMDNLLMLVPEDARSKLELHWAFGRRGKPFRSPAAALRDTKRLLQMRKLFDASAVDRFSTQLDLIRAYRLAGLDREEALPAMEQLLRTTRPNVAFLEEYCWLLRGAGKHDQALRVVENASADPKFLGPAEAKQAGNLLVERARIHAAQQAWKQAAADLEEFFCWQEGEESPSYVHFSAACLMQGFLLERQQKPTEAQEVWRRGLPRNWRQNLSKPNLVEAQGGTINLQVAILSSLTEQLSDTDARLLLTSLAAAAAGDSRIHKVAELVRPGVLLAMWRTPRGREWARRIAFRDLSFSDYLRAPVFLTAVEMLHQVALPAGTRDMEEDDLLWQLAGDLYDAYLAGTIKDTVVIRLALMFRATWTGSAGWQALTDPLGPRLRGPMAYVYGHRYLRGGKRSEAEQFFRTALADAKKASDARLERLARRELNRLKR